MNVKNDNPLWKKIQNFAFDEPGATISFSQKLAMQQNWSADFTKKATDEYRKFIFLCCIAENGAAPSKIVDEVWHLHLTYTKSYWVDFCKNTLNKEIHHHPSKGGTDDDHKHQEWYKQTLQLYETLFAASPPTAIWPPTHRHEPENTSVAFPVSRKIKKLVVALMALPFLFTGIAYHTLFPFHLTGPQFLVFYPIFGLLVILAYLLLQQENEKQVAMWPDEFPVDATIFQWARFLYGRHRALQAAIVDLIKRDLLVVNNDKSMFVFPARYRHPGGDQNPLIPAFLQQQEGSKVYYEGIDAFWYKDEDFIHPGFKPISTRVYKGNSFTAPGLFYAAIIVMGTLRVVQGMFHQKPVSFLLFEIIVLGIILAVIQDLFSLKKILIKKAEVFFTTAMRQEGAGNDTLVKNFVVQGTPAIAGFTEGFLLASVFSAFDPLSRNKGTGYSGSSCGSGSSCSGGSSCGGSGCGGCGGGGD